MERIKICYYPDWVDRKPDRNYIAKVSSEIGHRVRALRPKSRELLEIADNISHTGYSFCPAIFKDGKRRKENFEQQQFFALDFDNSGEQKVTINEIKNRAEQYELPIFFAYETFSVPIKINSGWYF